MIYQRMIIINNFFLPGKDILVVQLHGQNIVVFHYRWSSRIPVSRGIRHCNTLRMEGM